MTVHHQASPGAQSPEDSAPPLYPMLMPSVGTLSVLATIAALRVARPVVLWLRRRQIAEHYGAALVVFGALLNN